MQNTSQFPPDDQFSDKTSEAQSLAQKLDLYALATKIPADQAQLLASQCDDIASDRSLYDKIAADRNKLATIFGFPKLWEDQDEEFDEELDDTELDDTESRSVAPQVTMSAVEALVHGLSGPGNAASILFGRFVPALPSDHELLVSSGFTGLKAEQKRRLWTVKHRLASPVQARIEPDADLITVLRNRSDQLRAAILEPLDRIDWQPEETTWVQRFLGIAAWPAHPESWRDWLFFVVNDRVLNLVMHRQAKRYVRGSTDWQIEARNDLVAATKYEVFLSGINSASSRAKALGCNDLRAEIFCWGFQKTMQRLLKTLLTPIGGDPIDAHALAGNPQEVEEAELNLRIRELGQPYAAVLELKLALHTNKEIAEITELRAQAYRDCAKAVRESLTAGEQLFPEVDAEILELSNSLNDEADKLSGIKTQDVQAIAIKAAQLLGLEDPNQ